MERIALISDIHGNVDALRTVLIQENVDEWICLGDIVGYNPDPEKCVKIVQELCEHVIAGNHDRGAVSMLPGNWFNSTAREALKWTEENLSNDSINYIKDLPLNKNLAYGSYNITITHGYPDPDNPFKYIINTYDLINIEQYLRNNDIIFIGHTHVPGVFRKDKRGWDFNEAENGLEIRINPDNKYIVNVGSVGQPRDGNPQAAYNIFEPKNAKIEIRRLDYDVKKVQDKIYKTGLPYRLASRLERGR